MKIAYNFNNRLIVQEVSELPTFEHIVIDNIDLSVFFNPILLNGQIVEGATPEEIAQIQMQQVLKNETEMYRKRQCDGVLAYAEISAEFRLAKLSGLLSEEQHGQIEAILIPVRNEVLAGQWISAKQKLEEIGIVIGADLYNRLHTQITNYINENY
jgi:hypothetical protein